MHWHLSAPREWAMNNPARFDGERIRAERRHPTAGIAHSTEHVVAWLEETLDKLIVRYELTEQQLRRSGIATERDRAALTSIRRDMAHHGRDIATMLAISNAQVVHYAAYAAHGCTVRH